MEFDPPCAKKVELYPKPEMNKLPQFEKPAVSPLLIKAALTCAARYDQFNHGFLRAFYAKHGKHCFNISGSSITAYESQLNKLKFNQISPSYQAAPALHLAFLKMVRQWGVTSYSLRFQVNYDKLRNLLNKDTSIGFVPMKFLEVVQGGLRKASGLKKKDIVEHALQAFESYVAAMEEWVAGTRLGSPPRITVVDVEMLKFEVLWNHDELDDPNVTAKELDSALEKVRLFYMSSIFDYMLSVVSYKHISESVRYCESALGVKPESGGLQVIWRLLNLEDPTEEQLKIIEKWRARGIDLAIRVFGQGDWSKYDQTLLAMVLLFVCMFAWPFFSWTDDEQDPISRDAARVMYFQFVVSNIQKIMYVNAHGFYEVFGCMFSGKFITSIGDTIYQMLLKRVYFERLLRKYKNDELLEDIIAHSFILFFFYGDDHLASWPKVLDDMGYRLYSDSTSLLKDFINFCVREFGMNHKEKEFKLFSNAYSQRYFSVIDGVFVEDLSLSVEGPTFLKNQVAEVYVKMSDSWEYVDRLPYRLTVDIVCKMMLTTSSTGNIALAVMGLRSLARLCSGNLEAYSMVRVLESEIRPLVGDITPEMWESFASVVSENSMRRAIRTGDFPSLDVLILEQRDGFSNNSYVPKDFNGYVAPKSYLYEDNGMGNEQRQDLVEVDLNIYTDDAEMVGALMNFSYLGEDNDEFTLDF